MLLIEQKVTICKQKMKVANRISDQLADQL